MARRSFLIAPGDEPDMLRKATRSGADVVVFDLEDGVVPDRKEDARETVRDVLAAGDADCEICVRVNPIDQGVTRDLDVVLDGAAPDCVMLPKTDESGQVGTLSRKLRNRDAPIPVVALVESAPGILNAPAIAAAAPTDALVFGAEDLAGDIGAIRTPEGDEISHARQHAVLAARTAGVDVVDTHYPAFEDEAGLRADATHALELGYDGKLAIHPAQVDVIHEAFTPDEERVAWARRVLEARDEAGERGVFVVDDEMIDAPQVRQAERILERADE